jgi:hypothetical protein
MTLGERARLSLCLILLACAASCSNASRNCQSVDDRGTPVDTRLMAFLSRARAAHHLADLKEDAEPAQAVNALLSVLDGPLPQTLGTTPTEVREVMADTQARIAELLSREKHFSQALDRITAALELVPETNYFRGHLFETRGLVEQRQADELRAHGNLGEAEVATARALQAFEMAMHIQAAVIRSAPTLQAPALSGGPVDAGRRRPTEASTQPASGESER